MTARSRIALWLTGCALVLALAAGPGAGVADESDHEQARQALQAGKVLPLRSVLDIVERDFPGQVVKVEFEEDDGVFLYEIDPYFRASAGVASRDGYLFKASGGGPLVDNLLYGSVTAVTNDAPGRLDNPATGASRVGGASANAGAARLRLAPAGSPWELGLAISGECTRASQDAYVPFDDLQASHAYTAPGMPASLADFYQKRCGNSQALTGRYDFDGWRLNAVAAWQALHYDRHYPIGPSYTSQPERWRQQVQELRLSTTGQRAVDGVLGLYRQRVTQSRAVFNQMQGPMPLDTLQVD